MNDHIQLGALISDQQTVTRDAIHVPVFCVIAGQELAPGTRVGIGKSPVHPDVNIAVSSDLQAVGIIDPYLTGPVLPGQRCWMLLLPGMVTQLSHQWVAPAIDQHPVDCRDDANEHQAFINKLAEELDISTDELMGAADRFYNRGGFTNMRSENYKQIEESRWSDFWRHYSALSNGIDVTEEIDDQRQPFTCCNL